jgi:hypothetical protein
LGNNGGAFVSREEKYFVRYKQHAPRRRGAGRFRLANHYVEKGYAVSIALLLFPGCEYQLDERIRIIDLSDTSVSRVRQLPKWVRSIRKTRASEAPASHYLPGWPDQCRSTVFMFVFEAEYDRCGRKRPGPRWKDAVFSFCLQAVLFRRE